MANGSRMTTAELSIEVHNIKDHERDCQRAVFERPDKIERLANRAPSWATAVIVFLSSSTVGLLVALVK